MSKNKINKTMNSNDLYDLYLYITDTMFDFYNNIDEMNTTDIENYFNRIKNFIIKKNGKIILEKAATKKAAEHDEREFSILLDSHKNTIIENIVAIEYHRKLKKIKKFNKLEINRIEENLITIKPNDLNGTNNNSDLNLNNINVNKIFNEENKRKFVFVIKTDESIKRTDIMNKLKSKKEKYEEFFSVKEKNDGNKLNNYYIYIKCKTVSNFPLKEYKNLEYNMDKVNRNKKRESILSKGEKENF